MYDSRKLFELLLLEGAQAGLSWEMILAKREGYRLTIDLNTKRVTDEQGLQLSFELDEFRRHCLLNGLDDIALTLAHEEKISA